MPTTKKAAAPKGQTTAPHPTTHAPNGAPAGPASTPTSGPIVTGSPTPRATSATSGFGYLGWFTVDAEGCTVRFGIEPQQYLLPASAPNYNAMFSMLLACWLERHKVDLTYAIPLTSVVLAASDAPRNVLSLTTI